MFFRIIIPTYGDEPKLKEAVESVVTQDNYSDLAFTVISHDGERPVIHSEIEHVFQIGSGQQLYNGGNRNFAMHYPHMPQSEYTLFLDHDDTIPNKHTLANLKNFIEKTKHPDVIRLSYTKRYMNDGHTITKHLKDRTLDDMTVSNKVAPWTKCVKTKLLPDFPENTLFEDVLHHLKVCDICNTYANFPDPVVEWRMWDGQTSTKKGEKWESSKFRFVADLMDFHPKKKLVEERRQYRIKTAIETIIKDEEEKKNVSGEES